MPVCIIFQTGDVLSTASSSGGIHPGAVIGIDTFLQAVCKKNIPRSNARMSALDCRLHIGYLFTWHMQNQR